MQRNNPIQAEDIFPGACRAEGLCLWKLREMMSAHFLLFYFLFPSINLPPPSSPPLKSLPCISGTLGVPKTHREAVAALNQSTEPGRGYSGAIPLGPWVQELREWALRLLICP